MPIGNGGLRSWLTEATFANVEGMTPEDVARRRAMAEACSGWGVKIEGVMLTDLGRVRSLRLFSDMGKYAGM